MMVGQFVQNVKLTDLPELIIAEYVNVVYAEWTIIAHGKCSSCKTL